MAGPRKGRLPKLNDVIAKMITDSVSAGVPYKFASQRAGIAERTFHKWMQLGRDGIKPFAAFYAAIKKAESDAVLRNSAIIQSAAKKSWTAAAWWLERRYPSEFGQSRREITELRKHLKELEAIIRGHGHASTNPTTDGPASPGSGAPGGTAGPSVGG